MSSRICDRLHRVVAAVYEELYVSLRQTCHAFELGERRWRSWAAGEPIFVAGLRLVFFGAHDDNRVRRFAGIEVSLWMRRTLDKMEMSKKARGRDAEHAIGLG